jgi:hypothetical protein
MLKRAATYALIASSLMALGFVAAVSFVAGAIWLLGRLI